MGFDNGHSIEIIEIQHVALVRALLLSGPGEDQMLKIQRRTNGDVVFTVSGRLDADNISELSALLARESTGRVLVLDLKDVVLVDRDVVRFLRARETDGITLRNCPRYIREWIVRGEEEC